MKKIISLALIICFALAALVACSGDGRVTEAPTEKPSGTNAPTEAETVVETVERIDPEEHDYGGETLVMLIRNDEKIIREFGSDVSTEEINENLLYRNEMISVGLNLEIVPEYIASGDLRISREVYAERIKSDINGDLHKIDITANAASFSTEAGFREYAANLLDKEQFPYFDFRHPSWNRSLVKNSNVNGVSTVCGGDFTMSVFNFATVINYNYELYTNYIRDPETDPVLIQDLVLDGKWTVDKLYKWTQVFETRYIEDKTAYGLHLAGPYGFSDGIRAFATALQLEFFKENRDGTHSYNFKDNTTADNAINLYRKLYNNKGNAFLHRQDTGEGRQFLSGRILFDVDWLSATEHASEELRGMEYMNGLLPMPKANELQSGKELTGFEKEYGIEDLGYYTTTSEYCSLISVLDHSDSSVKTKGKAISAYLQYAAELSYYDVRGYYFEKVLRPRLLGSNYDEDGFYSIEKNLTIFDMIINNIQFDYGVLYSTPLGNITKLLADTVADSEATLESKYKENQQLYDEGLAATDKWLGLIKE